MRGLLGCTLHTLCARSRPSSLGANLNWAKHRYAQHDAGITGLIKIMSETSDQLRIVIYFQSGAV